MIYADLSLDELQFVLFNKISDDEIFDAKGMRRKDYQEQMRREGKIVAYNVTACYRGHRLRTRSGHCIMCSPASLAYMRRNASSGYVYIAKSDALNLVKCGYSKDYEERERSLNRTHYAEARDWKIIYAIKSDNAGKIETFVHSNLAIYSEKRTYDHEYCNQLATELFSCDGQTVRREIKKVCDENKFKYLVVRPCALVA